MFSASLFGTIVILSGVLGDVVQSVVYSLQSSGTYVGRVDSWSSLLTAAFDRGYGSAIFGEPFGFGTSRIDSRGIMISYAPHNWYVSVFLRLGLVGLVLFLCLLVWAFARLARGTDKIVAMSVFLGILAYLWSYSMSWHVGVFFAWTLVVALQTIPRSAKLPMPRISRGQKEMDKRILSATAYHDRHDRLHTQSTEPVTSDRLRTALASRHAVPSDQIGLLRVVSKNCAH